MLASLTISLFFFLRPLHSIIIPPPLPSFRRRLQSFSEESNLDDDGVGHRSPTSTTQRTEIIDGNSGTSTNDRSDSGAASGVR